MEKIASPKWLFPSKLAMMKISASFPHEMDAPAMVNSITESKISEV